MDEKYYYENLLTTVKGICTILFTGTTESSNPHVHQTLQTGLNVCLSWQNAIYKQMESLGFYQVENVDQNVLSKEQANIEPLNMPYKDNCQNQDHAR